MTSHMGKRMLILQGISGSGKSTYAKKLRDEEPNRWEIVSRDTLRYQLFREKFEDPAYMLEEYFRQGLDFAVEEEVTKREHLAIVSILMKGKDVIIDNTNLKSKYIAEYLKILYDVGLNLSFATFVRFDVESIQTAYNRIKKRGERFVSLDVLQKQWDSYHNSPMSVYDVADRLRGYQPKKWFVPSFEIEPYIVDRENDELPRAIICDLDGTLAHRRLQIHPNIHYRGFYDYEQCGTDTVDPLVSELVKALHRNHIKIIFVSGRKSNCREITENFIMMATGFEKADYQLFMRDEKIDYHDGKDDPDDKVKYRLFNENIRDKYDIIGAIDDRKRVVALWESLGIRVLNVGLLNEVF